MCGSVPPSWWESIVRKRVMSSLEKLLVAEELLLPVFAVHRHGEVELLPGELFEPVPADILVSRHPPKRAFDPVPVTAGAVDDPFEDPHVFGEARPQELSVLVFSEPVHGKDPGRVRQA